MKTKFSGILTLFLAFVVQLTFAQEKTISGVVSDDQGLPLPAATVLVKGTSNGTSTDFDGNYQIKANANDVLVFTYVGYANKEMTIGTSNKIDVTLEPDNQLDEIVIEAFRTTKKETSNVAAQTITSETIDTRPNASFVQTLQGQVAGLNITTSNGQPGGNSTINLRGVNSISGNSEPLFIIDGIPVDEDNFRSLNPNEIGNISVLKDAGATAIYGNRGANGVIVITTKRGKYDSPLKVKYTGTTGFSTLQSNDYNLMGSLDQLRLEKQAGSGFGSTLSDAELAARAAQTNTDWLDVFFGTATTQSHTLSLSSGGSNVNSFTSFGYNETDGILSEASTLKRFNVRSNLNGKSNNGKFKYGTSISLNYSESNEANNVGGTGINRNYFIGANQSVPYISPNSYIPGQGANIPVVFENTPLFLLDLRETFKRNEDELKILANVNASYDFTDHLSFKTNVSADFTDEHFLRYEAPNSFNAQLFAEPGNETPGFQQQAVSRTLAFNFNNFLTYKKTFNEKHTVEATVATEYFKAHLRSFGYFAEGLNLANAYPGDDGGFIDDNADNDFFIDTASASIRNAGLFSYFGFVDYDYDTKYGFSATLRRDASYRFASTNRWGTFWSVAGRWNISNENFMDNVGFVDVLKLRGSYGTTGNQRVIDAAGQFAYFAGADLTRDLFAPGTQYAGLNGTQVSQLGNSDLKWEVVKQLNIGVDFQLFNSRLRGAFDWYKKNTEDLFLRTPISPSLNGGISNLRANVGELQNSGFDAELQYDVFKSQQEDGFNMTLRGVVNYNKQEIKDLGATGDVPFGNRVGGVLGEIYAAPYAGVNPANGNLLFVDINGNITEDINENDQRATGKNIFPDYQGSFGIDIDYKNFFFTTTFNYTIGVYRFDGDYAGFMDPNAIGQFRHSKDIQNAWTQPGDVTNVPSLNATNLSDDAFSDRFLRNSDYLRLRFIQFGYSFPKKTLGKMGLDQLRLFAGGENLLTFSEWRGFDAEANNGSSSNGYPTPKTYSLGLEIAF
jgi:TonB-linked SusC/RagA family outer membrane protein